jgi:hypothetical protein
MLALYKKKAMALDHTSFDLVKSFFFQEKSYFKQ